MTPTEARPLSPVAVPFPAAGATKPFTIPSLDGLRAASFLIVFLSHALTQKWVPGYFGLSVFFFLSGYLITTLLRMEFDQTGGLNFRDFYLRRALRIFPPFYLILGLAYALTWTGVLQNPPTPGAMAAQMLHMTNYYIVRHGWWTGIAPGTWIYWSLAVEEHFYLLFPLLYLAMRRRGLSPRGQAALLLGLCAAVLLWRCLLVFGLHASKDRLYVATDTRVDSILFGCVLAVWGNPALDAAPASSEHRLKYLWLPLAVAALLVSFVVRHFWFDQTLRYTIQGLALFPIFMAAVRLPSWGVFRLLNLRPVQYVGLLSYSLYLLHTMILAGLDERTHWPHLVQGVIGFAASLSLAALIYRFVERPCARLRKRLSQVRRPPVPSGAERSTP